MGKFALFSSKIQNVFETEDRFMNFSTLAVETALGTQQVDAKDANKKINEETFKKFFEGEEQKI